MSVIIIIIIIWHWYNLLLCSYIIFSICYCYCPFLYFISYKSGIDKSMKEKGPQCGTCVSECVYVRAHVLCMHACVCV